MNIRIVLLVVLPLIYALFACGQSQDIVYLQALMDSWQNRPPSWVGSDPCGDKWDGIFCNDSRVTSITLVNINLMGFLSGDIGQLSELQLLDLSYNKGLAGSLTPEIGKLKKLAHLHLIGCSFIGPLPHTLGSLPQLSSLSLNANGFSGPIPPSIGNLSKLFVLDLADNMLSGPIPVSDGVNPGLDLLFNTRHFHFGNNRLSGEIPSQLFNSNMTLIHVLFEDNQLTGTIPFTLGLVQKLEVLRLDRNLLSGHIPSNINCLTLLRQLYLSNNKLEGPLPDLSSMTILNYLDMSNNSFESSEIPPWFSSLQSLTTLMMHDTGLKGEVPVDLFHIPHIETLVLRNNRLNGTLDFGDSYSESLKLIDMSNNLISAFVQRSHSANLMLINNPVCKLEATETYCHQPKESNSSYSTPSNNCIPATTCSLDQISSPNCKCAYPYTGTLTFKAPSFSDLGNSTIYTSIQSSMMSSFESNRLPVDSVSLLSHPSMSSYYFVVNLEIFPSGGERFSRSEISMIGFLFSSQTYRPPSSFGPYSFLGNTYLFFSDAEKGKHKMVSIGVIIGGSVGGCVLVLLLFIAGLHVYRKRRAEKATSMNTPFASWDPDKGNGDKPQLKGPRSFTFEELNACTNNFTPTASIGSGGYGMVYRGTLPSGQLVAIKRAQHGSIQSGVEFINEIEVLSRVHHKNLVSLVGFSLDAGKQMLVYEYAVNGSLKDSLLGRSGIRLDWTRRLQIILGAARGLQYLHDLVDPPIIHSDVKSTNILLDTHLNAKVSDFGLSKPLGDSNRALVTTHVKGTVGYIDPEYYVTQQMTKKSDVYSFGIVMLELITARNPVDNGKHIVRVVKESMDRNFREVVDPTIGLSIDLHGLERFVDVAFRCVEKAGNRRPKMSDVVKEIENIMEATGVNPNGESASTSESYGWETNGNNQLERSPLYM